MNDIDGTPLHSNVSPDVVYLWANDNAGAPLCWRAYCGTSDSLKSEIGSKRFDAVNRGEVVCAGGDYFRKNPFLKLA
jgi:ABC-type Fe3+-hydroxamate transport system substrate-binding protein